MNGAIVLFAVLAMTVIAIGVICALRRRIPNDDACGSTQDESVLLL